MARYLTRAPLVVEAYQWMTPPEDEAGWPQWLLDARDKHLDDKDKPRIAGTGVFRHNDMDGAAVHTLEGSMPVEPGDWIVKGSGGFLYPVRDDIFRETHEAA